MICTIELCGCDAITTFRTELNETEVALLQRIAEMSRKTSIYGCMPTMCVAVEHPPEFHDWYTKENYEKECPFYANQDS